MKKEKVASPASGGILSLYGVRVAGKLATLT
jgi:hypothetical protein